VPKERVFLCKEYAYTGKVIQYFTSIYRACIGACVAGQGDVMIGAGVLMARANGLSAKTFASKFIEMAVNNETTFTMGVGSIALGGRHPSGVWIPDSLTSHTNKIHVATLPYETKRLCQEIGGGIDRLFSILPGFYGLEIWKAGAEICESRVLQRRSPSTDGEAE
jgi:4-hydroxybutyryl-CoA dehydratase/vinylacetyl-CoA-Delta-isomerase